MTNQLPAQVTVRRFVFSPVLLAAVAAAVVLGCSGVSIREDQRIPLTAGAPFESVVKTTDYTMEYQLVYRQADSSGGGKLAFKGKLVPRRGLDSLSIWINFLDAEGKTIGSKALYSPGAGRGAAKSNLEQTVDIPPGTVSVAFTHNAREKRPLLLG